MNKPSKILLCTLFLFVAAIGFGQGRYLRMINQKTGKIKVFNELKRVTVKTVDRKKFRGRMLLINKEQMVIRKDTIAVDDILKIKSKMAFTNLLGTLLVAEGATVTLLGLGFAIIGDDESRSALIIGAGITAAGILMKRAALRHPKRDWNYEIVIHE